MALKANKKKVVEEDSFFNSCEDVSVLFNSTGQGFTPSI